MTKTTQTTNTVSEDQALAVLMAAVTLAKNNNIQSVARLKTSLKGEGFTVAEIDAGIDLWLSHVRKYGSPRDLVDSDEPWGQFHQSPNLSSQSG